MMRPTINEESDCLRKKNLHRRHPRRQCCVLGFTSFIAQIRLQNMCFLSRSQLMPPTRLTGSDVTLQ